MSETIVLRQYVAADAGKTWAALTDATALATWLSEHAEVALGEGQYAFWGRFSPGGDETRQRLLETDAPRGLRFGWPLGAYEGEVEIELEPEEDGTRVTLTHRDAPPRAETEIYLRDWWQLSLENLANFVEGRSLASRVDFTSLHGRDAGYELEIAATPEEVFAALIEPEQLERWFATNATIEPEVGGRYDLGWGIGPTRILELIPNERLTHDWATSDDEPPMVVRWELEGSGGRTHLTVVQSGFSSEAHAAGWSVGLASRVASLKRMLEVGVDWRPVERLQHAA